jgi:16S rRNA (adenine1518-N6/adenine1519-N6)-dimethyltransferase
MDTRLPQPRKRFGQNFLHDQTVIERIVTELAIDSETALLEIGPGRGALTRRLLEIAGSLVAVEIDRDLVRHLRESFPEPGLQLVEEDILELDLSRLAQQVHRRPRRWTIAANLPYNISKPIAMRLVESVASVDRAVLMFQREVAQRLCAAPGGPDYGPLSVLPRAVYDIQHVTDVSPGAFHPKPAVISTVTRWVARDARPSTQDLLRLRITLRAAFSNRRKTLKNNVRAALGSDEVLQLAGLDGTRRAQELTPEEFRLLAAQWPLAP